MATPPPIPKRVRRVDFIERARVGANQFNLDRIQKMRDEAETWMNQNPDAEILSVETLHSALSAMVTVWYRS